MHLTLLQIKKKKDSQKLSRGQLAKYETAGSGLKFPSFGLPQVHFFNEKV